MIEVAGVPLVCPSCKGALVGEGERLVCADCDTVYPVVAGVPDLRVAPDPWIGLEDDRAKALRLLDRSEGQDFAEMVRTYWSMTPDTPAPYAERFTEHVLGAPERSAEWLDAMLGPEGMSPGPWLDEGCGTADLAEVAPADVPIVGIDLAMRWLVAARRRLEEAGRPAHLICANAEALPFPDASFRGVTSVGMLEHCHGPDPVLLEARRVLVPGGRLILRTVNRFTLLPEPHVGVWGVGWLPRAWAPSYVRRMSGQSYEHHRPLSLGEITRSMRRSGFDGVSVRAAISLKSDVSRASGLVQRLTPLYERARRLPLAGPVVSWVAPLLDAKGVAA